MASITSPVIDRISAASNILCPTSQPHIFFKLFPLAAVALDDNNREKKEQIQAMNWFSSP